MTNLREARDKDKLEQFIKEREGEKGDAAAVDRTISAMAAPAKGKSKKR